MGENWTYNIVSTIFLHIHFETNNCSTGSSEESRIAGTSTKNRVKEFADVKMTKEHVERMGALMEDNESDLRF